MCKLGWPSAIEARTPWITAGVPLSEVGFPMLPTNKDVNSIAGEEDACKKGSKRIHEVVFLGPDSVIKHTIEYVLSAITCTVDVVSTSFDEINHE